ncbi:MAG TPA: ATP-binding protein [Candidatus Udaeobacter sp.]|nr:ATP-binding protein [Candidatus Udaeobacter sp.]
MFAAAAVTAALSSAAFVLWLRFEVGGVTATVAVDDIGEAVAALAAAVACAIAAKRSVGRLRLAWTLLAVSSAAWAAGEIVWSVYEVALGVVVPFPSAADAGFLTAIPFAVAGILAFSSAPRGTSRRWRVWLDGLIIAVSLLFVAWVAGLDRVVTDVADPLLERGVDLAYPVGDIVVGTVLVLAIRRASGQQQGRLMLLLGGLGANALADSAFAYLTATGTYGEIGSVLDAGWVAGYLMVALAALWPSTPADAIDRAPIDIWQLALPWFAVLAAGIAAVAGALHGHPFDLFMSVLAGTLLILLMVSQFFAHKDSLSILTRSRNAQATLSEVIGEAPIGVIRIGTDMRIASANPRYGELVGTPAEACIGTRLAENFADHRSDGLEKFRLLAQGAAQTVDGDDEVVRKDGTTAWLHWKATAVHTASGSVDYFIAMLDDTTARHTAEEAAAANLMQLERLNQLKSDFLQTTRHEFRSALVGIQGFSELIRDVEHLDPAEVKQFAADIYDGARKLDEMIDEMLSLDRAEAAGTLLTLSPTDVNAVITSTVEKVRGERELPVLCLDLNSDLPIVPADPAKTREVIETLVHNAIKYSPDDGQVVISSRVEHGEIVVTVKDQGVGVRADFDNRLYGQGDLYANNPIRKVVGTGLGLAIARQIVELHGGRIWVDRIDGVGSHFHFTLPIRHPTLDLELTRNVHPNWRA